MNHIWVSQVVPVVKKPSTIAGDGRDIGLISGKGRSPGIETGNPLQYSCLENSMDRGPWQAVVHVGTWSRKESNMTEYIHPHTPHTSHSILLFWMPNNFCLYSRLSYLHWKYFFKEYSALFWHAVAFELFEFFKVSFIFFLLLIQGSLFPSSVQLILLLRKKF